jgi:ubiquinone/menaquinone biosynthesis C-methylase UbiE
MLLPDGAMVRSDDLCRIATARSDSTTQSVMRFYDEVGWTQLGTGTFRDAEIFEDIRHVSHEYIRRCHLRINRHVGAGGKYLLDIACGPIQYDEYLSYSSRYTRRLCCDISLPALRAAKSKLGEMGIYIQCDITNLPFKDGAVDAFISLHTIFHVAAEKQSTAFRELERVLADGGSGLVVYSWGAHCRAMKLLMFSPRRAVRKILMGIGLENIIRLVKRHRKAPVEPATDVSGQSSNALYFHAHGYAWYKEHIASKNNWRVYVWRSVSVEFLKRYIHGAALGKTVLSCIFWLEETLPGAFGRFGQYPLFVLHKYRSKSVEIET